MADYSRAGVCRQVGVKDARKLPAAHYQTNQANHKATCVLRSTGFLDNFSSKQISPYGSMVFPSDTSNSHLSMLSFDQALFGGLAEREPRIEACLLCATGTSVRCNHMNLSVYLWPYAMCYIS